MAKRAIGNKIPTTHLPVNWKSDKAVEHGCSENKIERIVYGLAVASPKNLEIFDEILALATEGRLKADAAARLRQQQLETLNPIV